MEAKSEREKTRKEGRLVIEGNAFYELDMECLEKQEKRRMFQEHKKRGGRGVNPLPRWSEMEISSRSHCFHTEEGE